MTSLEEMRAQRAKLDEAIAAQESERKVLRCRAVNSGRVVRVWRGDGERFDFDAEWLWQCKEAESAISG